MNVLNEAIPRDLCILISLRPTSVLFSLEEPVGQ